MDIRADDSISEGNSPEEKAMMLGGYRLEGDIRVSGSKNSALAIMAASLCADGVTLLENVPDIGDIHVMMEMLDELGCKTRWSGDHRLEINTSGLSFAGDSKDLVDLVRKMRASFTILGPLLARFGEARVALPGGCEIGTRSVDFHIKGLRALGAEAYVEHGFVIARTTGLVGTKILLDFPSVGATNHLISTAVLAQGHTVIENAAQEPEIIDLARFLNSMGARIKGAGTRRIEVEGVRRLHPTRHRIIPDRIEAATYAIAGAMTGGDVLIRNVVEDHLLPIILKLRECGIEIRADEPPLRLFDIDRSPHSLCSLRVISRTSSCRPVHVTAAPHPGFPTDAHPVLAAMLTVADGPSIITETVYDRRFRYCSELQRMGAKITVNGQNALIEGTSRLTGARVSAPDLRGGAALVLAGLIAEGETEITGLQYIDRGYEAFVPKLQQLGAKIERVSAECAVMRPALCFA